MTTPTVISRHRLPPRYRLGLAALWLVPPLLLVATPLVVRGFDRTLLDPRLWLPLLVMALPALYIWQEGVDVRADGIVARFFWPRFYAYPHLDTWVYDSHPRRRVITVWNVSGRKVLECRAGHLTDARLLLDTLHRHVRNRRFPR